MKYYNRSLEELHESAGPPIQEETFTTDLINKVSQHVCKNGFLEKYFEIKKMEQATRQFHEHWMQIAIEEAKKGRDEGGIPIGSALIRRKPSAPASSVSIEDYELIGRGHNQRIQKKSAILHAEMDCYENAGRLTAKDYRESILYSTLSPCDMCSGTTLLYRIPKVIIGENKTFKGPEEYVQSRGVQVENLNNAECIELMETFIRENPTLWNEDIGE